MGHENLYNVISGMVVRCIIEACVKGCAGLLVGVLTTGKTLSCRIRRLWQMHLDSFALETLLIKVKVYAGEGFECGVLFGNSQWRSAEVVLGN